MVSPQFAAGWKVNEVLDSPTAGGRPSCKTSGSRTILISLSCKRSVNYQDASIP